MGKDIGNRVTEIQTDKGIVFSIEALGSSGENWTYFTDRGIRRTYGAYVTSNVCEPIRQLYLKFRDSTSDRKSEDYRDKLSRLIRVGRSEGYGGEKGYALILVHKNKEYDLKLHKIVRREFVLGKSETPEPVITKPAEKPPKVPLNSGNGDNNSAKKVSTSTGHGPPSTKINIWGKAPLGKK